MKKQEAPKDRHLDVPSEANRDKHANFLASDKDDPAVGPTKIFTGNEKETSEDKEEEREDRNLDFEEE